MVLQQHGHGPQDERQEEVEVDVVPGAAELPATHHSVTMGTGDRAERDVEGRLVDAVTGEDRGWRSL